MLFKNTFNSSVFHLTPAIDFNNFQALPNNESRMVTKFFAILNALHMMALLPSEDLRAFGDEIRHSQLSTQECLDNCNALLRESTASFQEVPHQKSDFIGQNAEATIRLWDHFETLDEPQLPEPIQTRAWMLRADNLPQPSFSNAIAPSTPDPWYNDYELSHLMNFFQYHDDQKSGFPAYRIPLQGHILATQSPIIKVEGSDGAMELFINTIKDSCKFSGRIVFPINLHDGVLDADIMQSGAGMIGNHSSKPS